VHDAAEAVVVVVVVVVVATVVVAEVVTVIECGSLLLFPFCGVVEVDEAKMTLQFPTARSHPDCPKM